MGHKEPQTIANVLKQMQRNELVLPSIQREFVWKPAQVIKLFDSLLQGYPVGSFLSWRVGAKTIEQFKFYGVMKDYSAFNNRHNPVVEIPTDRGVVAVLDGQQRLTSLNIGLRGTYAYRNKGGWKTKAWSYPERRLFLNVLGEAPANETGLKYEFAFLTEDQFAQSLGNDTRIWVPVGDVYEAAEVDALMGIPVMYGFGDRAAAVKMLGRLWRVVHETPILHFYEEEDQDIDRVLDIFVRVNSQGTKLSYSDLLMSIAVAQWEERDARAAVHKLVDDLNATGQGFDFDQDTVLKAGLVLTDVSDFGFRVKNFTRENTWRLEEEWDSISRSLRIAAELLSDFGLSGATLTANSVLIPVAYYVHRRALPPEYRVSEKGGYRNDRNAVRNWVLRSLVVPGVWGSGLDTLLRALRDVIRSEGAQRFPAQSIERAMAARGKSLDITDALIDDIVELGYGSGRTWAVLGLLFDNVDTRMKYHVDHVFPSSSLQTRRLKAAKQPDGTRKFSNEEVEDLVKKRDMLPNLELLPGPENTGKSGTPPDTWLADHYPDPFQRAGFLGVNALPEKLPHDVDDFLPFFELRRELLKKRIRSKLGVTQASDDSGAPAAIEPDLDTRLSEGDTTE